MDGHLHGAMWLNAATYPEIKFVATKLDNVNTSGDTTTADAVGTFTLKGVTKEMTVPVKLTYLEGKLGKRLPARAATSSVLRSHFQHQAQRFQHPSPPKRRQRFPTRFKSI